MIVSDRHRFVFIHNPKCAGTSLRQALAPYDDRGGRYWGFAEHAGRRVDLAHLTLSDLEGYPDFLLLAEYFVFTVVRHPLDRALSAYREFITKGYLGFPADGPDDFVLRYLDADRARFDFRFVHFCPQHHFTHLAGKCRVDWIVRFERLEADLAHLPALLGVPAEVGHENLRAETPLAFGPEAEASLRSLYARDFQLFGYD